MIKLTYLLSLFTLLPSTTLAFTLNTSNASAFAKGSVSLWITENSDCQEMGLTKEQILSEAVESAQLFWNQVVTADIKVTLGGIYQTTDNRFISGKLCPNQECPSNQAIDSTIQNIILSCNNNAEIFPNQELLALSAPLNIRGNTIVGSVILLNNRPGSIWGNYSSRERVTILAHEIGHALGIGHSRFDYALMYPFFIPGQTKLADDDRDALSYLYPHKITGCFANVKNDESHFNNLLLSLLTFFLLLGLSKVIFPKKIT
jgi:hypothetical protein